MNNAGSRTRDEDEVGGEAAKRHEPRNADGRAETIDRRHNAGKLTAREMHFRI